MHEASVFSEGQMKAFHPFLLAGMLLLAAEPAMAETSKAELADRFVSAASHCTGKWQVSVDEGFETRTATEHLPRREWLTTGRDTLDHDRARAIYDFANAMIVPAFASTPKGVYDASPMIKCTPDAVLGLAVMKWLSGSQRSDLRGPANVYSWIAAAEQHGVGTAVDPEAARRNWLRWHIAFGLPGPEVWSDGVDDNPYGNIERAGLLHFLRADAADKTGDAARRILAAHLVASDQERARALLSDIHLLSGRLRLDWEKSGRLAARADSEELKFWLAMARRYPGDESWRAKAQHVVAQINGGTIPVHAKRLGLAQVFASDPPTLTQQRGLDQTPVGLRALVDRDGKLVMIDRCDWTGETKYSTSWHQSPAFREAWGLFTKSELKQLPAPAGGARYGWVALPVIAFSSGEEAILREIDNVSPDCRVNPVREMPKNT